MLMAGCGAENPTPLDLLGYERAPWVLDAISGTQLVLRVIHGCTRMAGVDAIESDDRVEVRAWVDRIEGQDCFLNLRYDAARVELDAPLGTRELVGCMLERSAPPFAARSDCSEIVQER
jgi:hypothetical protein